MWPCAGNGNTRIWTPLLLLELMMLMAADVRERIFEIRASRAWKLIHLYIHTSLLIFIFYIFPFLSSLNIHYFF